MSKLVTLEQAKKLKELGYREMVWQYFCGGEFKRSKIICDYNADSNMDGKVLISTPSISEALDWFREVKEIECEVCLRLCFMGDTGEAVFGGYEYIIFDHNTTKTISSTIYNDRKVAESALLDALIEYVSE